MRAYRKALDPTYDYENDTSLCSLCHHNTTFHHGLCADCWKKGQNHENDSRVGEATSESSSQQRLLVKVGLLPNTPTAKENWRFSAK